MNNPQDYDLFDEFEDPVEGWYGRPMRKRLSEEWAKFLDWKHWTSFVTLTFRGEVYPDMANKMFLRLIRKLNEDVFGKRYKNICKHSYFSYIKGIEYQKRDVLHFHFLADLPINYKLLHEFWNQYAGFAVTKLIENEKGAISYVCKYAAKDGDVTPYFQDKLFIPEPKPEWWVKAEILSSKILQKVCFLPGV